MGAGLGIHVGFVDFMCASVKYFLCVNDDVPFIFVLQTFGVTRKLRLSHKS